MAFMTMITPKEWNDGFEETLGSFLYSRHALILEGLENEIVGLISHSKNRGFAKAFSELAKKISAEGLSVESERRCFKRAAAAIARREATRDPARNYQEKWRAIKKHVLEKGTFTISKDDENSPFDDFFNLLEVDLQNVSISQKYVFFLAVCGLCELLTGDRQED